jgi:hypothetical protein
MVFVFSSMQWRASATRVQEFSRSEKFRCEQRNLLFLAFGFFSTMINA